MIFKNFEIHCTLIGSLKKNTFANLRFGFFYPRRPPPPGLAKDHTFSGFFFGNLPLTVNIVHLPCNHPQLVVIIVIANLSNVMKRILQLLIYLTKLNYQQRVVGSFSEIHQHSNGRISPRLTRLGKLIKILKLSFLSKLEGCPLPILKYNT